MTQIVQVDVRKFMAEKQASGLAPKSLQKIRLVFRQVLELARGSGAIKVNPCDGIRLPRAVQSDPIFLSATQVESLARAARPARKSVVQGKSVSVRVDLGGRRIIKKNTKHVNQHLATQKT